jgi:hypothetical protein
MGIEDATMTVTPSAVDQIIKFVLMTEDWNRISNLLPSTSKEIPPTGVVFIVSAVHNEAGLY